MKHGTGGLCGFQFATGNLTLYTWLYKQAEDWNLDIRVNLFYKKIRFIASFFPNKKNICFGRQVWRQAVKNY